MKTDEDNEMEESKSRKRRISTNAALERLSKLQNDKAAREESMLKLEKDRLALEREQLDLQRRQQDLAEKKEQNEQQYRLQQMQLMQKQMELVQMMFQQFQPASVPQNKN